MYATHHMKTFSGHVLDVDLTETWKPDVSYKREAQCVDSYHQRQPAQCEGPCSGSMCTRPGPCD